MNQDEKIKELEQELAQITNTLHTVIDIGLPGAMYGPETLEWKLRHRIEKLETALEKIADPRKRDHKEPDKYTECACLMYIAEEALKKDES